MTAPFPVVVNRGGGAAARAGEKLVEQIEAAFDAAGLKADVHAVDGCDVIEVAKELAKHGAVAVGGGDGTQGCAADVLAKSGATLGILPLGTRNHLARELGIPIDLEEAVRVIAGGHVQPIDLSTVNDHSFVNNASIGIYPQLVRLRDAQRERSGVPKWIANFPAAWSVLRRLPRHRFRLRMDDAAEAVVTPLLFVGNNIYSLDAGKVGSRDALDDGKLSVFAVAARSRAGLIGFALRTLAGRSDAERDFAALGVCETLTVESRKRRIDVALDGEIKTLAAPLTFRVCPSAVNVFVPAPNRA